MRAGALRHQLEHWVYTPGAANAAGEIERVYVKGDTVWGSVEPLRGKEFFEAQKESAAVTHRVKVRHGTAFTAKDQVRLGSRKFEIKAVINPLERDRELHLMCIELVDGESA